MAKDKLRRQLAWEAARLMYTREETEYFRAKLKAARRIASGDVKPRDLPSNREIRDQVQAFARLHEGERRLENLRQMRLEALRLMRILRTFKPRLIGSVMTGHVRQGSDIDLHVFSDSAEAVAAALDQQGMSYAIERKRVRKHGEERSFTHIHVEDRFAFELTVYPADKAHYVFKSSITSKAIERAGIAELEQLLKREYPDEPLAQEVLESQSKVDPLQIYEMLLLPLERVKESPVYHPEGDALYHSLQVFDLAREEFPYDEEFLSAALLHDVGKAIIWQALPEAAREIMTIMDDRHLSQFHAEQEVLGGANHCLVGAWASGEWNLPTSIVHSIQMHHTPLEAKDDASLLKVIHIANAVCYHVGFPATKTKKTPPATAYESCAFLHGNAAFMQAFRNRYEAKRALFDSLAQA